MCEASEASEEMELKSEEMSSPQTNGNIKNPNKRIMSGVAMKEGINREEDKERKQGTQMIHCKRYSPQDGDGEEGFRPCDNKYLLEGEE
jgi:hypothetical protein